MAYPPTMMNREAEEAAIAAFIAAGRMKKLETITDPQERAIEFWSSRGSPSRSKTIADAWDRGKRKSRKS